MGSLPRLLETIIANALVCSHHIFANAVGTYAAASGTLVDVLTGGLVGSQLVPRWTLALERTLRVDAMPSFTQPRYFLALVNICAQQNIIHATKVCVKSLPMQTCIGAVVRYPSSQSQIKSPGIFLQVPGPHTLLVVMEHSSISANTDSRQNHNKLERRTNYLPTH